jgi:hypothetical protein
MLAVYNEFDLNGEMEYFFFEGHDLDVLALAGWHTKHGYDPVWVDGVPCVIIRLSDAQVYLDILADLWDNEGWCMLYNETDYVRTPDPVQLSLWDVDSITPAITSESPSLWAAWLESIGRLLINAIAPLGA